MGQGSYVMLLIVITVVMAVALVAFAIAFDRYVMKSGYVFYDLNQQNVTTDLADGNVFDTVAVPTVSLKFSMLKPLS